MPEAQRQALGLRHFEALGRNAIEMSVMWFAPDRRALGLVSIRGKEHLDRLRGKPIILLVPHFIGLNMGGARIANDYPGSASIYSRQKNPVLDRLFLRGRTRFGAPTLLSRQDGMRAIVKTLREGRLLYYLPDLDYGPRDAVFVPFFGVPAATITGLSRLAAVGGARVVPCVTRQLPRGGGYVVRFYPAWEDFPSGDETADARRMNAFIEERVREMPEQYFWAAETLQDPSAGRTLALSAKMTAMRMRFAKMHGQGNDFVVIDGIRQAVTLTAAQVRKIADRHTGVGCDQVLLVESARDPGNDFRYRIWNADGGEVEQCGNGARCFARFVRDEGLTAKAELRVETIRGVIVARIETGGQVRVDMGAPRFAPAEIPFSVPEERLVYSLEVGGKAIELSVLSMGNPHAVQRVPDVDSAPVATQGPLIENHPAFPQRVNAGYFQVIDRGHIRLRVWERGAGETLACGTGACAAVVAGIPGASSTAMSRSRHAEATSRSPGPGRGGT